MTALPALTSFWLGFFLASGEENSATALSWTLHCDLQRQRSDSFLIGGNRRESFLCFMECGREQGQPYRVKNEERRAEVAEVI